MVYSISQPNFLYGHLLPPEDSLLRQGKIFCVADGITRDPLYRGNLTNKNLEAALKYYPNPSGARLAADTFCNSFVGFLKKKPPSTEHIRRAFVLGNKKIAQLNKGKKNTDYLVNDFFGCVAVGGAIRNNKLFWGGICDCGIIIYDKNGEVKFQTTNWIGPFAEYEKKFLQKNNFNFMYPEYRRLVRSEYRNKPQKIVDNKCVSYGALTGEKEAKKFMHFGEVGVSAGDLIVFYSDGFEFVVRHKDFFKKIYHKSESLVDQSFVPFSLDLAKQNYEKFGKERTLVAIVV